MNLNRFLVLLLVLFFSACAGTGSSTPASRLENYQSNQERPAELKSYSFSVPLVEQEGDPRGVELIMKQVFVPAYATAYFWSTWKRQGDAFASTQESNFYDFQTFRESLVDGPEGMKLGVYKISFKAPEIQPLRYKEYSERIYLNELATTDLRRTNLTTVFIPRILRRLDISEARVRLVKVDLIPDEALEATVWIAE